MFLVRNVNGYGIDFFLSKKVYKKILEVYEIEKFDIIFAIAYPFELFEGVYQFSKNNSKDIYLYQVDLFTTVVEPLMSSSMKNLRNRKRSQLISKYYKACRKIYTLDFIYKQELNNYNSNKIEIIKLPLVKVSDQNYKVDPVKIVFTYTGSLNIHERSPEKYLHFMDNIIKRNKNVILNFYYRGDVYNIIDNYKLKYPKNINNYGLVSSSVALEARKKADVLVSISTYRGNQIAGKTFEYISMGKPIIFLYYREDDENILVYNEYELSLCINVNEVTIDEFHELITNFISKTKGKTVAPKEILDKYYCYTPNYISYKILNEMRGKYESI